MKVVLIAAASENNVIGRDGQIPWHLSDDLKHFRELTDGHPVIMGRKTFESIGHPLPNRRNIVTTRQNITLAQCEVAHSVDEALRHCEGEPEAWVIGGGEIYREALPKADRIELTRVHVDVDGDAFFPEIDLSQWRVTKEYRHEADEHHLYPFTFQTYERTTPKTC